MQSVHDVSAYYVYDIVSGKRQVFHSFQRLMNGVDLDNNLNKVITVLGKSNEYDEVDFTPSHRYVYTTGNTVSIHDGMLNFNC